MAPKHLIYLCWYMSQKYDVLQYHILNIIFRFLESYAKHNISFWGLTTQNEPTDGLVKNFQFNAVGWSPQDQVRMLWTNA